MTSDWVKEEEAWLRVRVKRQYELRAQTLQIFLKMEWRKLKYSAVLNPLFLLQLEFMVRKTDFFIN